MGVGGSANVGRYNAGEAPNITGEIYNTEQTTPLRYGNPREVGALYLSRFISGTSNPNAAGSYEIGRGFAIDASRSSSVYKNVSRIISHGIMTFYLIKYI